MYAVNWGTDRKSMEPRLDPLTEELKLILELRQRVLESRDLLYCSPMVRHLVEQELPRLIALARG